MAPGGGIVIPVGVGPPHVTVSYTPASSTLTVALAGSGMVSGSGLSCPGACSRSYPAGTVATLAAQPAVGSRFTGWAGGGCSGTAGCSVTLNGDRAVVAMFGEISAPECTLNPRRSKLAFSKHHRRATLTANVTCDRAAKLTLRGRLTEHGRNGKTFKLGPVRASANAAQATALRVDIPNAAVRAVKRGVKESADLTVTAAGQDGTSRVTARIGKLTA
jgi:hypothetical protein